MVPAWPDSALGHERALGTDQTNETVIVDERVGVKWLLHPDPARERAPRRCTRPLSRS